eukprot:2562597-Amphidinium_carterae.1
MQPLCSVGVAVSVSRHLQNGVACLPKQVCTLEEAEELTEDVLHGVPNRLPPKFLSVALAASGRDPRPRFVLSGTSQEWI